MANQSKTFMQDGIEYRQVGDEIELIRVSKELSGSVTIPEGVTTIPEAALYGRKNIGILTLPESLKTIEEGAFQRAEIEEIRWPQGRLTLKARAFYMCKKLKKLTVPDNINTVPEGAFAECPDLQSVHFEKGVKTIGIIAFYGCPRLESVTFEKQPVIRRRAFFNCPVLQDDQGFAIVGTALVQYSGNAAVVAVPEGVTIVCATAIRARRIHFPNSVKQIEDLDLGYGEDETISNIPAGYLQQTTALPEKATQELLQTKAWKEAVTDQDWAAMRLYQTAPALQRLAELHCAQNPNQSLRYMCAFLGPKSKTAHWKSVEQFYELYKKEIEPSTVDMLRQTLEYKTGRTASRRKASVVKKKNSGETITLFFQAPYVYPQNESIQLPVVRDSEGKLRLSASSCPAPSEFRCLQGSDEVGYRLTAPQGMKPMSVSYKGESFTISAFSSEVEIAAIWNKLADYAANIKKKAENIGVLAEFAYEVLYYIDRLTECLGHLDIQHLLETVPRDTKGRIVRSYWGYGLLPSVAPDGPSGLEAMDADMRQRFIERAEFTFQKRPLLIPLLIWKGDQQKKEVTMVRIEFHFSSLTEGGIDYGSKK